MTTSLERLGALVFLAAFLVACENKPEAAPAASGAPSGSGVVAMTKQPDAKDGKDAKGATAPTLFVAGAEGVREVGLDGSEKRKLSGTAASAPRVSPDGKSLYFVAEGKELRKIALEGQKEDKVAALPEAPACAKAAQPLSVQAPGDFVVDATKNVACLRLQDRNDNMVSVRVLARVDLASGKVESAVETASACKTAEEKTKAGKLFDCKAPEAKKGALAEGVQVPEGLKVREASPSGAWALLEGGSEAGDQVHTDLFLLEAKTGKVYPVAEGKAPAPLSEAALKDAPKAGKVKTASAAGETPVFWLEERDVLVLGDLVVIPGERAFRAGGSVISAASP